MSVPEAGREENGKETGDIGDGKFSWGKGDAYCNTETQACSTL